MLKVLALLGVAAHHRAKQAREAEELYARKRLLGVVERARVVSIDGKRNACGMGPDGPLWPDQVRAMIALGERASQAAQ